MIRANSIRDWVREHTLQDTLQIMENGEAVYFVREKKSLSDATATMYLTAAYLYFGIERERRSEIGKAAYRRKAAAGKYTPRDYFGYVPGTFTPSEEGKYVVEMFAGASGGAKTVTQFWRLCRESALTGAEDVSVSFLFNLVKSALVSLVSPM